MYVCSYSGRVSTLEQAVPTRTAGGPPRAPAMPTWMPCTLYVCSYIVRSCMYVCTTLVCMYVRCQAVLVLAASIPCHVRVEAVPACLVSHWKLACEWVIRAHALRHTPDAVVAGGSAVYLDR